MLSTQICVEGTALAQASVRGSRSAQRRSAEASSDPAERLTRLRPGLLFVLSGPSGVGKDAVIARLRELGVPLHFTITCTTREMRPGESDGAPYYFVTAEQFASMQRSGELLEWANVHGNLYGTPLAQVRDALAAGKDVLLKIDVQGAAQVKQRVPNAIFIFLAAPSMPELIARLTNRRTESETQLQTRITNAYQEMKHLPDYDYIVVNQADRLDEAVERIQAIIVAEGCRVQPREVRL